MPLPKRNAPAADRGVPETDRLAGTIKRLDIPPTGPSQPETDDLPLLDADHEAAVADDRLWFQQHAARNHRLRFACQSEIEKIETLGGPLPPGAVCVVTAVRQIRPGLRVRAYARMATLTGRPDAASEQVAADLFRMVRP